MTTEAPPREMTPAERAIAIRKEAALAEPLGNSGLIALESVNRIEDLDRFQVKVMLHPVHQYEISGKRVPTGRYEEREDGSRGKEIWVAEKSVQPTSDGYDYLNRWMGVQLHQPDFVPNSAGEMVPNPIIRGDEILLRLMGIYYNDIGQLVTYREDIAVDFMRVYQDARLNAVWYDDDRWEKDGEVSTEFRRGWNKIKGAKHTAAEEFELRYDEAGMPVIDENGNPVYDLRLPREQELKAIQTLSQLRRFGVRYAFTVAKTRVLKQASGIRRLPISEKKPVALSIVGFRDLLRPDQRIAKAEATAQAMYGVPIDRDAVLSLTDSEVQSVDGDVVGEFVDVKDDDHPEPSDAPFEPTPEERAAILAREEAESKQ